uniref:Uncharacterized protein n=1 Tax=Plectus sambesii TaxID=2011161 RepID=A0A914VBB3_9BILA
MHPASATGFIFGLLFFVGDHRLVVCEECSEKTIASPKWQASAAHFDLVITLDGLHLVQKISISGPADAFFLKYATNREDDWREYLDENGQPQVFRSHSPTETESDDNHFVALRTGFLARRLQIAPAREQIHNEGEIRVDVIGCKYSEKVHQYGGDSYSSVNPSSSGLLALYYNDLYVNFRTTADGVLFASQAGQGDLLLLQIKLGVAQAYFDFGSRTTSLVSGGTALDDGQWHELRWSHQFNMVLLFVDGVQVDLMQLTNAYRKLDFDAKIHIGGVIRPQFPTSALAVRTNMTGCIRYMRFNQVDVLAAAEHHNVDTGHSCKIAEQGEMTFETEDSTVTYTRSDAKVLSVQFRTFSPIGNIISLLDDKDTVVAQVRVKDGNLVLLVSSLDMPARLQETGSEGAVVADGAWHSVSFSMSEESLSVELDGQRSAWMDGMALSAVHLSTDSFLLGGGGLIGCMRMLQRDGVTIALRSHAKRTNAITFNACHLISRCDRNPCENGGNCSQVGLNAHKCRCTAQFSGPTCHTAIVPHSCEEYFLSSGDSPNDVMIDVDGGGPLAAIRVLCSVANSTTDDDDGDKSPVITTQLNHDTPMLHVRGFADAGGFYRRLDYGVVGVAEMDQFVTGFNDCAQEMTYECRGGATLMSHAGSPNRPSSWYVGRNGHHGLQWGDAQLQSRMCSCANTATCIDGGVCNCDSGKDAIDSGNNTHLSLLPVTELFIGGTDSRGKNVSVSIGPLRCVDRGMEFCSCRGARSITLEWWNILEIL